MSPWFCGTKSALLSNFTGQSLYCSMNLRGKLEPSYFPSHFYGAMLTLLRKIIEQCRLCPQNHGDITSGRKQILKIFFLLFKISFLNHSFFRNLYSHCNPFLGINHFSGPYLYKAKLRQLPSLKPFSVIIHFCESKSLYLFLASHFFPLHLLRPIWGSGSNSASSTV